MASFMQNWWAKHDMDRDANGCFFIAIVIACALMFVGVSLGMIFVFAAMKAF